METVSDPDDNAGDADKNGDGSAYLEDKFVEYDSEDDEPDDEPDLETLSSNKVESIEQKVLISKLTLGWPIEDLLL